MESVRAALVNEGSAEQKDVGWWRTGKQQENQMRSLRVCIAAADGKIWWRARC